MPKLTPEQVAEGVLMYERGLSIGAIAAYFSVTRQAMWERLSKRGVVMRPNVRFGADNHFFRGGERSSDRVHNLTEYAIRTGIIARAEACEDCGEPGPVQAHHDDYNRPLAVRWLCWPCHHRWHQGHEAILLVPGTDPPAGPRKRRLTSRLPLPEKS